VALVHLVRPEAVGLFSPSMLTKTRPSPSNERRSNIFESCDLDGILANMQGLPDFPFGQAESEINHGEP
jgi:hypothetical protein